MKIRRPRVIPLLGNSLQAANFVGATIPNIRGLLVSFLGNSERRVCFLKLASTFKFSAKEINPHLLVQICLLRILSLFFSILRFISRYTVVL